MVSVAGLRFLSGVSCAIAVTASLAASAVTAQTVNLSPAEVRALASSTLRAGDPATAANTADLLLARFPEDPGTLLIRTEAAILLGDFAGASTLWPSRLLERQYGPATL